MIQINTNPSRSELKWFAGLWFPLFLLVVGSFSLKAGAPHSVVYAVWIGGLGVAGLGFVVPAIIRPVFIGLSYLTFPIGFVMSIAVLAVIYFAVLSPISLLLRAFGRDSMSRRFDRAANSYWHTMARQGDADSYFRQF